jgi:hypothetical protein
LSPFRYYGSQPPHGAEREGVGVFFKDNSSVFSSAWRERRSAAAPTRGSSSAADAKDSAPVILGIVSWMNTLAIVILAVLVAVPLVIVGVMFMWAAVRDGEEDRALQARLGIRRRTRLGR